jgi:DNA-binding transcriptional LysR family regulator
MLTLAIRYGPFHLGGEHMGLTPPLQKLVFALAVVRELHFGRAARRLNISQPYLSRTIREYEGELGFALFRRNRRIVELTAAGRAFLKHAKDILADLDNAYDRAVEAGRLISRQSASSLVIGCSAFVPPRLRCQTRTIQRLRFPTLHLELRVASPTETIESIRSGVFQAGVTYAPLDRDDLAQIPLGSERLHAVFPRAQSVNGAGEITLTDLRTRPLIVPCSERTHPALRRWLLEQCEKAGFRPNIVEELSSADGVFDLVQDGVGVAILPGEACDGMPPDLQCTPISNLEPVESVLAYRREAPLQVQKVVTEIAHSLRHFEHKRKIFSRTSRSAKRPIVSIGSRRPRTNNWGASHTA